MFMSRLTRRNGEPGRLEIGIILSCELELRETCHSQRGKLHQQVTTIGIPSVTCPSLHHDDHAATGRSSV